MESSYTFESLPEGREGTVSNSLMDRIEVYRQNHVRIRTCGRDIHIDPFMTDSAQDGSGRADIILITHDHYDHFSPKDIERTACGGTVLVVPENMKDKAKEAGRYVREIVTVKPNENYVIEGLEFETVPAYNILKPFHPKKAGWVGYIIKAEGKRVYVAGDTDATPEAMAVKCDIALVPVGGTYTMNAKEAAGLVNTIRPEIAVPVHYGRVVGSPKDGAKFADAVNKNTKVILKINTEEK